MDAQEAEGLLGRSVNGPDEAVALTRWARLRQRFKEPGLVHMFPVMFLYTFCFSMYEPSLMQLVVSRACEDLSSTDCNEAEVTGYTAKWMTYTNLANSILPAIIAGSLGVLSDRFGRRMPMAVSALGGAIQAGAILLFYYFKLPFWTLVIAGALHGLLGGPASMFMALFSYVADSSDATGRSLRFSMLAVIQYIGILAGNMAGGFAIQLFGFGAPFWPIAGFYLLTLVVVICVPESLSVEKRQQDVKWRQANIFGAFSILFKRSRVGHPSVLLVLAVAFACGYAAFIGFVIVLVLYAKQLFGWGSLMIAFFASAQCAARAVGVLFIAPVLFSWRTNLLSPASIICLGLAFQAIAYAWYARAHSTSFMFLGAIFEGLSAIALPTMRSVFSRAVSDKVQGRTLASISAIETMINAFVPVILMAVFSATSSSSPRFSLYLIVAITCVGLFAALIHARITDPLPLSCVEETSSKDGKDQTSNGTPGSKCPVAGPTGACPARGFLSPQTPLLWYNDV